MKFTEKDFTPSQFKAYEQEDDEVKEMIIDAMNRKEIVRTLGVGKLFMKYNYRIDEEGYGILTIKSRIEDKNGKILWQCETEGSNSSYGGYDGEESVSELVEDVLSVLLYDLGEHEEGININLFKRIIGYGR